MTEQRAVAPELKQRFICDWIDLRTGKGIATYGTPLKTHNGRDAKKDMTEELLDFSQYQQQYIMELEESYHWKAPSLKPSGNIYKVELLDGPDPW